VPNKGYPATQEQVPEHLRGTRGALARCFGRTVLNLFGWRVVGNIPNVKRPPNYCRPPHLQLGLRICNGRGAWA
jgi:hypothetical protein